MPIIIPLLDDKEECSVDELDDHILLLETARHRLDVEWCESIGVFEGKGGHHVFGYPNLVAYLKGRARIAASRANRYALMARAARRFKATLTAWRCRHVSSDQAELLFQTSRQHPDEYPSAEPALLEIAGESAEETRKMLDYWRHTVDRRGVTADFEAQMRRRRFDYTRRPNGMIEGGFALTGVAGEVMITALDALMPPSDDDDERTASQRRHDAFEDLARGYLEGSSTPLVGGERPHLNLMVDLDALRGVPGGIHETEDGHVIDVDTIRQLACDSTISRIVWSPPSEILDVGRKTRTIPAGIRRAVIVRDRHCTWKNCPRGPGWCDVHHVTHWADGGETVIENLRLLCRYHHTLVHGHEAALAEPVVAGRST